MGMFRTVWAELPCRKCGARFRVGVQFKTGDDGLEDYEEGVAIPPEHGLLPGQTWEGIGQRYCKDCRQQHQDDYADVEKEALASMVEAGGLVLTHKKTGDTVEASAIRESDSGGRFDTVGLEITWRGTRTTDNNEVWSQFYGSVKERVDAGMRERGWAAGGEQYDDWVIIIADECRPYVGERL
jgi:hypothetical protein